MVVSLLRDQQRVTVAGGQSDADSTVVLPLLISSVTGRVLVDTATTVNVITMTGTLDNSNTAFTASSTPTLVVVNGNIYRNGHGVTISGTSVTTDAPVGENGDIYGL